MDFLRLAGLPRYLSLFLGSLLLGLIALVLFIHVIDILPLINRCSASLLRLFNIFAGVPLLVSINFEITVLASSPSIHVFLFQSVHLLILIVPLTILLIRVLPVFLHLGCSPVRSALGLLFLVVILATHSALLY